MPKSSFRKQQKLLDCLNAHGFWEDFNNILKEVNN